MNPTFREEDLPSAFGDKSSKKNTFNKSRKLASNFIRAQIDAIYNKQTKYLKKDISDNAYDKSHNVAANLTKEEWENFHSSWKDYYQKYYERYYLDQINIARSNLKQQDNLNVINPNSITSQNIVNSDNEDVSKLKKHFQYIAQEKFQNIKKSKHFIPVLGGMTVIMIFLFLQYNQILIANVKAYISPGNVELSSIIVDHTDNINVDSSLTNIIIPKINVDAPVDYTSTPDNDSQMAAMEKGLAYFPIRGASSKPGEIGNTPISGHSSNDVFAAGNYKFIFAQLEKLVAGDIIYANYEGIRYTYIVTKTEIVLPTEVNKLIYETDKPIITLITCTPLGTAEKRLLVTAEQISPNPENAKNANSNIKDNSAEMTGTTPTLIERLFGAS